jgi:hypothetical protein
MADVTVLVRPAVEIASPQPSPFRLARAKSVSRLGPVMVTLDSSASSYSAPSSPTYAKGDGLLSPPINTWKSRPSIPRPASAPPSRREDISDDTLPLPAIVHRRRLSFAQKRTHELPRPAPPVCTSFHRLSSPFQLTPSTVRPTTFWRRTRRSGVTGASYSPSSHLIRRSTFIAAGLDLDRPTADLSAFCVESRIGLLLLPPEFGQ